MEQIWMGEEFLVKQLPWNNSSFFYTLHLVISSIEFWKGSKTSKNRLQKQSQKTTIMHILAGI